MREIPTTKTAVQKAEKVKVTILRSLRESNTTSREILCSKCNEVTIVQDQTLSRWARKGTKFCAICHGANKGIPDHVRVDRINESLPTIYAEKIKVVKYLGYFAETRHSKVLVKFLACGHEKEYATCTLNQLVKQGKAFKCDECSNTNKSCMESWADERIVGFETQVPYACIASTKRRWIADYYSEKLNTIIEVTTGGQKSTIDYSSNLQEKREWCDTAGIKLVVVDNLNNLEDIVRTLEKV